MAQNMLKKLQIGTLVAALAVTRAIAAPIDSDLAAAQNGGGCYPIGTTAGLFDALDLVNPEWAAIVPSDPNDSTASIPVTIHGTVDTFHGDTGGDFPATHVTSDAVWEIDLDPADADRAATGNGGPHMGFEWEHGSLQPFAWPGEGDRVVGLGRWIFDCGHPDGTAGQCSSTVQACILDKDCPTGETCVGAHFGYEAEMHSPQALAVIRSNRGGVIKQADPSAVPVLATRADVFVSADAGGVGDRCILTHRPAGTALLGVNCFPVSDPVAPINGYDFFFDVPVPPKPTVANGARTHWSLTTYATPGGGMPAKVRVRRRLHDTEPHLEVRVRMKKKVHGQLPTGFAGTIYAGWLNDPTSLTHVRVTVQALEVLNALKPAVPIAPKDCSGTGPSCSTDSDCVATPDRPSCTYLGGTSKVCQRPCAADTDCRPPTCPSCASDETCLGVGPVDAWAMQAAMNGEWQRLTGLEHVTTPTTASDPPLVIPQSLVYDQFLPAGASVRIQSHGVSKECVDTMLGKSLGTDLGELGLTKGLDCLTDRSHVGFGGSRSYSPGNVDETYPSPEFGAGMTGTMDYAVQSTGGHAGHCSTTTDMLCVWDEDCPASETCTVVGGAYTLHYRIERLPN
jgi:hypothetical protein